MSDKRFYTYVWFTGNRPIYVGKGTADRYMQHAEKAWFHAYDVEPRLFAGLTEDEALALEATLIERFGLDNLANRDKGSALRCDLVGEQEAFAASMEPQPFNMDDVTDRVRRIRELSNRHRRRQRESAKMLRERQRMMKALGEYVQGAVILLAIAACVWKMGPGSTKAAPEAPRVSAPRMSVLAQMEVLIEDKVGHAVSLTRKWRNKFGPRGSLESFGFTARSTVGDEVHSGSCEVEGGRVVTLVVDGAVVTIERAAAILKNR